MLLKVKVNYPEDMSIPENNLSKGLAEIFIKKFPQTEIDKLIEILDDESINMLL